MNSHHVNSCHKIISTTWICVICIHIYHKSSYIWICFKWIHIFSDKFIFHNCLSNVWRAFESHQESQVLVFTKWCDDGTGVLTFIVKLKRIVWIITSSLAKNLYPQHLRALLVIIHNGYCLRLMTLFSWRELLIQHTLLSSYLKVFKWIQGTGWGIECTGLAFG